MHHLNIDIETFSDVAIKKAGLYRYVQSPAFQVMLFGYSLDGAPVRVIDLLQGEVIPEEIVPCVFDPGVQKHAYNASFEWYCLSKYFGFTDSVPWLSQWRCSQLHGLYCGYPKGLAKAGEAIGLPQDKRKSGTGSNLIRTFCVPCKPSRTNGYRTRTLPHHEPDRWQLFKQYCAQDVVTEMEFDRRLSAFPVPEEEQRLWELDQRINSRGVAVDPALIDGALSVSSSVTEALTAEAVELSGLDNPNSVKQLSKWLQEELDEEIDDLRKDTVKDLLGSELESDKARRMLEIRQELAKTSVKKYTAMKTAVCEDNRIRGTFLFYGANRTGRWAGSIVQLHNLPRNYLETLPLARELVKARRVDDLQFLYGNVPDTLSQLIRTAFVPSEGRTFLVADFSAIEARVIAWLAGEAWRQEVFRTHGKIYEASASAMFDVPIEEIGKSSPLRQKGKVAELALGYQGAAGALITMGALDMGLTEEELPEIVQRWRQANKRIVDLWYAVENAVLEVMHSGMPVGVRGLIFAREGDYQNGQDFFTLTLPSGRKLFYVRPFLAPNRWGNDSLRYYGLDQQSKKWSVQETYGGKLVENIVQAIARDCLATAMLRLEAAGYSIVMHVHDEVIIDAPPGTELDPACEIMGQPIPWAPGLLLRGDGFTAGFYKKD